MEKIINFIGYTMLTASMLAWMDTLWIFGVENSQHYTWWGLLHWLAN